MRIGSLILMLVAALPASSIAPEPALAQGDSSSLVLDVTRVGDGTLRGSDGLDVAIERARLRLRGNSEFELALVGDSTYWFAGTWSGDLRFGPISLDLREAFDRKMEGNGRAWVSDRSWDRDRSFSRVELDGWRGRYEFSLYFDTDMRELSSEELPSRAGPATRRPEPGLR